MPPTPHVGVVVHAACTAARLAQLVALPDIVAGLEGTERKSHILFTPHVKQT